MAGLDPNVLDLAVRFALLKALLEGAADEESELEKIFTSQDKIKTLLEEGNYSAASDLAKWRCDQNYDVLKAPALVQYYVTLVQNNAPLKATEVKDELIALLSDVDTSPKQLEQFASNLREDKPYEAVLFYHIAIHYCKNENDLSTLVKCLLRCCAGTSVVVEKGIEKSELPKELVISYIIPFMKEAKELMKRYLRLNTTQISETLAICLHCIEQCQKQADDLDSRETSLREAISLLLENLGRNAEKKKIFGTCLNNLGHTMLMRRRFDEAQRYFLQAISAKQRAENYDTVAEKIKDVQLSKAGLNAAKRGGCPIQ